MSKIELKVNGFSFILEEKGVSETYFGLIMIDPVDKERNLVATFADPHWIDIQTQAKIAISDRLIAIGVKFYLAEEPPAREHVICKLCKETLTIYNEGTPNRPYVVHHCRKRPREILKRNR